MLRRPLYEVMLSRHISYVMLFKNLQTVSSIFVLDFIFHMHDFGIFNIDD